MSNTNYLEKLKQWSQSSISLKALTIGFLILILLIPLSSIESLIRERKWTNEGVVSEVQGKWGKPQTINGFQLTVPYWEYYTYKNAEGKEQTTKTKKFAYFIPESMNVASSIEKKEKKRSLYEVLLYTANLKLDGNFSFPSHEELNIEKEQFLLDEAILNLGLKELASIHSDVNVVINNQKVKLKTGTKLNTNFESGLHCQLDLTQMENGFTFQMDLDCNASGPLSFTPLAATTTVGAEGTWPHISYNGNFLPYEQSTTEGSFNAKWKILHINRPIPLVTTEPIKNINQFNFSLELIEPINQYHSNTRAVKYGALVISLIFLSFLFVQMIYKVKIHPVQYLLVGFSICIFFVMLLAFSEHLNFYTSYLVSAISTILLNTLYFKSLFSKISTTWIYGLFQTIIYSFIFVLVNLEELSLVVGAIGLFIIISLVMFGTKNFKWYHTPQKVA